jgi:hypothetical protein
VTLLLVHEWTTGDGEREALEVGVDDGCLVVRTAGGDARLPMSVLERVMERYAKPLEADVKLDGPSLDLGNAGVLRRIRHRGFYDVIARDFIVWHPREGEPVAELATAVSAALGHFARVALAQ